MFQVKMLIVLFIVLVFSSVAVCGDPVYVFVCYHDVNSANALGCGCADSSRVPFADGTNMYIMWDANHATDPGPDAADIQPLQGLGYGETNFTVASFNGSGIGLSAGFFCFDPLLVISQPVNSDSSWYYIKICASSCQWYSSSFHVTSGASDVMLTSSDWTCSDSGCTFGEESENSTTELEENTTSLMFGNLSFGGFSNGGLTIRYNPVGDELILYWPPVCAQAYQTYKVYSSTSVSGPFDTLVATTNDTSLTLSLPADAKRFYTAVAYTDWDQIGIDHNRGMSFVVARLYQAGWDSTWTEEQALDSVKVFALDFIRDSTCYNYEIAEKVITETDFDVVPTYEVVMGYLDSLAAKDLVTDREVTYLTRLFNIVYLDTLLSDTALLVDSLNKFVEDVLAIDWNQNEIICLSITSIAIHSWEFQNVGRNFPGGGSVPVSSLAEEWAMDIGCGLLGAAAGSVVPGAGTLAGGLGSALVGSGAIVIHDIGSYWGWW